MDEQTEKPKQGRPPASYINTSSVNIFTEKGRVAPGQVISLKADTAKQYPGLEKCKT